MATLAEPWIIPTNDGRYMLRTEQAFMDEGDEGAEGGFYVATNYFLCSTWDEAFALAQHLAGAFTTVARNIDGTWGRPRLPAPPRLEES